jgi:acetyl-CoA carboxylase carboxyltransferase component
MLWTNILGEQYDANQTVRIGEAKKITLRALGIKAQEASFKVNKLANRQRVRFLIDIDKTVERYKNANFSASFKTSDSVRINSITYSDTDDCSAHVDVYVSEDENTTGSVSISNLVISNEF